VNHSYATYPGVLNVLKASYTLSPGITPSVVTMEIIPQTQAISAVGDVVFVHGNTTLTIPGCRADQASMVRGTDGTLVSFSLMDRRWRWKFGEIYGSYNQRDADGLIIAATEKTPQQLATLCLQAMGETASGVDAIPTAARPEVDWVAANPAESLADLLESFGLIVVLQIDGTVAIRQQGVGAALPENANLLEQQVSSNPPEIPATIRVLGGPNRYQRRLRLEAVAYDTDGRIRPINQLSYKPATGWGKETQFFSGVQASEARALALRDVFRLYRIRDVDSEAPLPIVSLPDSTQSIQPPFIPIGPIQGGGVGPAQAPQAPQQQQPGGVSYVVQRLREILPLEKGLVQTGPDANGIKRRKPEAVYGEYYVGNVSLEFPRNSSIAVGSQWKYPGRFTVEHDLGLVRFDEQVTRWDRVAKEFTAAELELECSFSVRNPDTNAQMRWSYTQATGAASGYGVEVVRREELVWERYQTYPNNIPGPWQEKTYKNELDTQSGYYAAGRLAQYVTQSGASGRYAGLQSINPDGAISQVTWEIGGSGCYTSASRLYEPSPYVPPYKERRLNDMLRVQRRANKDNRKGRP
jgi:hypothetical protein